MNKFIKGMFADYNAGQKLLVLFAVFILMEVFGNVVGLGCSLAKDVLLSSTNTLRLEQLVASAIIFIGTPYVFYYITSKPECSFKQFFKLRKKNSSILYILVILAWVSLLPVVNYTAYINEQMTFPESLHELEKYMKDIEDLAKVLTFDLLKTESPLIFLVNLIVIALVPAIGEEMTFRGALQKTLHKKMSPSFAIIVTSVIFSAMHLQFYGFVPRFILSVFLGMLYYFGGSIKLNVLAHFCNNAIAVLAFYICTLKGLNIDDAPTETVGKDGIVPVIVSLVLFVIFMWGIYKETRKRI